jgi:hypothetical protein
MKPGASIWKMGQLSFNRSAVETYKLDGFKYAVLFYDRDKKKIGIKFTNDAKEQGAGKVSMKRRDAMVFAKGFLEHFGIEHSKTKRFAIQHDEKNGMFVLEAE